MHSVLILALFILQAEDASGFWYKNCLPTHLTPPTINITYASVTDPVPIPGNITVAVDAKITHVKQIQWDNLKLTVTIKKKLHVRDRYEYITVPCNVRTAIGSCVYDRLCEFIETFYPNGTNCPVQLTDNGINCTCPLRLERLHLPPSVFEVHEINDDWRWVALGNYTVKLEAKQHQHVVGCVEFQLQTNILDPIHGIFG